MNCIALLNLSGDTEIVRMIARQMHCLMSAEDGVTAIEYALLASLIAMVALLGIALLGGQVESLWLRVSGAVTKAL